ncbi:pitrilysin family protein [uncultured Lactobacillus sp.]|uniref:M16 family metallopeptidase n=1 Tax=uncultured Lactobacillus sp. TaxID=153152 RepID=UPI002631E471|nr:pitrilysin family protein [uncultured Lactobacillus sp.]
MKKLEVIKKTFKSGFEAQIIRKPYFKKKFMGIIVDFGGSDDQKLCGGAHFLEHKLFAKKDGDISLKLDELGCESNAFTTYNETMFYASFVDHWSKVLELLFELAGTTYFTEDNVNKEKNIINQELAMYQDDPEWKVNHSLLTRMFPKTNLAQDLTGTHASIDQMDSETLLEIYKNHYYAQNLSLVACGDFSDYQVKKMFTQINKLQAKYFTSQKKPKEVIKKVYPRKEMHQVINDDVSISQVGLGIRMPEFEKFGFSDLDAQILLEMMLASCFSSSSSWFELEQKADILHSPLAYSVTYTRQGNFIIMNGVSNQPENLLADIKKELTNIEITEKEFERQKKLFLAKYLRQLNDIDSVAIEQAELNLDHESMDEVFQFLQTLSFSEFYLFVKSIIRQSDIFTTILEKNKRDKQ